MALQIFDVCTKYLLFLVFPKIVHYIPNYISTIRFVSKQAINIYFVVELGKFLAFNVYPLLEFVHMKPVYRYTITILICVCRQKIQNGHCILYSQKSSFKCFLKISDVQIPNNHQIIVRKRHFFFIKMCMQALPISLS